MFGTIRRHQAWLWWIIAGITIVSFVILGPSGCNDLKLNGLGGTGGYGKIGDHTITQEELRRAEREVLIRYYVANHRWPSSQSDFNVEREAYIRLFLIEKEKQFGIQVSPESMAEFARRIIGDARLSDVVTQFLKPAGLDEEDFERYLAHEAGAQQLVSVAGLSGELVTPGEAEKLYREEHQELACAMISLSASNFLPVVTADNPALLKFYTNRMSVYREPERMQVNYVKFNVTNYWTETVKSLTNLESEVDMEVKGAGTNLFGHAKTPEESRAGIKDYIIRTNALAIARRDAANFANELYNMEPKKPENIETLARQKGLIVKTTEPFDEVEGPTNLDVLFNFPKTAFQLTQDEPFGPAVPEQDGVYVLGFKKQFPSAVPPFKDVEAKVIEDFRYAQGAFVAEQTAKQYYNELTNGLAHGKSFKALVAELGVKTESLPPFSLQTEKLPENLETRLTLGMLKQAAFSTEVGHVSPPARALHGVFMVYVEKKLPIDEAKLKKELPGFLAYMRQARQADAFNQWFMVQARQDPGFSSAIQQVSEQTQTRSTQRRTR